MSTEKWIQDIKDVLQRIEIFEISEFDRKVIFRCMHAELIEAVERLNNIEEYKNEGRKWSDEHIKYLKQYLIDNKRAKDYSEASDRIMHLSYKFGRTQKAVKKKAIELGYGNALDWCYRNA